MGTLADVFLYVNKIEVKQQKHTPAHHPLLRPAPPKSQFAAARGPQSRCARWRTLPRRARWNRAAPSAWSTTANAASSPCASTVPRCLCLRARGRDGAGPAGGRIPGREGSRTPTGTAGARRSRQPAPASVAGLRHRGWRAATLDLREPVAGGLPLH